MLIKRQEFLKEYNNNRGSILVLSLLISSILIVLSGGILSIAVNEGRHTIRSVSSVSAINLAEAGTEYAIWEMNYNGGNFSEDDGWSDANPTEKTVTFQTSAGDNVGEYVMTVTNPGTSSVTVSTTAYVPSQTSSNGTRKVQVGLDSVNEGVFNGAAYGIESVTLGQGTTVDSFNSSVAAYDPDSPGSSGHVGTSSTGSSDITLGSGAYIDGDGYVGVSGDPETVMPYDDSYYSGTKQAQTSAYTPAPRTPGSYTDQGALAVDGTATISSSGEYSSISLTTDSILTIDQDVNIYVTGSLAFSKDSRIDIINGASVNIYSDGNISWDKDGTFNNTSQDPTKLTIYGTSSYTGNILIKKDTVFYGKIHAPNASISIDKDSEIYGALVAKNVNLAMDCKLHWDEALYIDPDSIESTYVISYWQEK